jgi:hypothetical protein
MTTTIEIEAFTFQELSKQAKQEVITQLAPEYDWWDNTYDHAKELGEAKGFEIQNIHFTGFWSQGDGACWVGRVDLVKWLELNKPEDPKAHILSALVENGWVDKYLGISTHNSPYAHSNIMQRSAVGIAYEDEDDVLTEGMFTGANVRNLMESMPDAYADDIADEVIDDAKSFADDIYRMLRDEYEYLCSEEVIAELCDANEYLFNKKGELL